MSVMFLIMITISHGLYLGEFRLSNAKLFFIAYVHWEVLLD
jgi:hypothetical protein